VAVDDDASGTEDEDVVIDAAGLAANDTDVDADTLTVSAVSNPQGGTVALDAGEITFTPAGDLCGDDAASFDYTVEDGNGGTDTGTVTIDLGCVNDAPVAVDDTATVDENSAAADHDVVANDTDVDGDELTLESVDVDPAEGTATIVGNKVQFTPAADFTGTATVTYVVTDGTDDDTGELVITVNPVGPGDVDPPVVGAIGFSLGTGRIDQTGPLKVTWSATDTESAVTGYEVEINVNGNGFQALYAGTGTSIVANVPFNRSIVVRVRATDGEGNTSDWAVSATRRVVAYQNGNQKVDYSGGRWRQVGEPRSSGAGHAYTTVKGASVKLEFRGARELLYVAPKYATGGKVDVFIDGDNVGRFNLKSDAPKFGKIITRESWASFGRHRVRIVAVNANLRTFFDTFLVLK
jgi:hypothetical protein